MRQIKFTLLAALLAGCVATALDRARVNHARVLEVAAATNARLRERSRALQEERIRRIGPRTEAAATWRAAFVDRRRPLEDQVRRCDELLSEAEGLLLLDDGRGPVAVEAAAGCEAVFRKAVDEFFAREVR